MDKFIDNKDDFNNERNYRILKYIHSTKKKWIKKYDGNFIIELTQKEKIIDWYKGT